MSDGVCPHHGVLQYKVDQTYTKIEAIERKTDAILAAVSLIESHRAQIASHSIALFGADNQGGIVADVREFREDKRFRNRLGAGILAFIAGNFALIWAVIKGKAGQ